MPKPPDEEAKPSSAWAPLARPVFRVLWIAVLFTNVGSWMQTVGAQWLLVHQPHASIWVALVQTADTLPDAVSRSWAACSPTSWTDVRFS